MEPPCKQLYTIETLHHRPSLYYSGICFPLRPPHRKKGESGGDFLLQRYLVQQHPSSSLHSHLFHFHDLPINQKCDKIWRDISSFFSLESFPYLFGSGWVLQWNSNRSRLASAETALGWTGLNRCFAMVMNHTFILSQHIMESFPSLSGLRALQQYLCPGDVSVWSAHYIRRTDQTQ